MKVRFKKYKQNRFNLKIEKEPSEEFEMEFKDFNAANSYWDSLLSDYRGQIKMEIIEQ